MDPSQIKEWRRSLGLTQSGLAKVLGVSRATVNRWERGRCSLRGRREGITVSSLIDLDSKSPIGFSKNKLI